MKKLIGTVAVAALLATAAFAQITFGAWLRVLVSPISHDGKDFKTGMYNSWGWGARAARINVDGVSEDGRAGFSLGVYQDAWDGNSTGDNCVMWVKPVDMLRVSFGKWDYNTFRGDLCFGSWNMTRPAFYEDEGLTFDAIGNQNGLQLELIPVDGLVVVYNLPVANKNWSANNVYEAFGAQHAGVMYTVDNVVRVKAAWKGSNSYTARYLLSDSEAKALGLNDDSLLTKVHVSDDRYYGDVLFGADIMAIKNLYITTGVKAAIADNSYRSDKPGFGVVKFAAGASYSLDKLKISANGYYQKAEKYWNDEVAGGIGLDFAVTDKITLSTDYRLKSTLDWRNEHDVDLYGKETYYTGAIWKTPTAKMEGGKYVLDDSGNIIWEPSETGWTEQASSVIPDMAWSAGVMYNCSSNGQIGVSFQCMYMPSHLTGFLGGAGNDSGLAAKDEFIWTVPIIGSVYF